MNFALIENGIVVNIAVADSAADLPGEWIAADGAAIGWTYGGGTFAPPEAPDTAPAAQTQITRLAFRKRFTQAEKVSLELAALDDPTASPAQRAQAAAMRAYLKDVDAAQFIDLADAYVEAGVQTLEAAGLLEPGRAAAILTDPVQEDERP
jgi:hypothetical protein